MTNRKVVALAAAGAALVAGSWVVLVGRPGETPASVRSGSAASTAAPGRAVAPTNRPPRGAPAVAGSTRLPLAEPEVEGSVERLLRAGTGKPPDSTVLDELVSRYRDGEPLVAVADAVVAMPAFAALYEPASDTEYVESLHTEVLGRRARAGDVTRWTGELSRGKSRGAVLAGITESPEYVERTGTPDPLPPRRLMAPSGVEHSVARLYLGLAGRWPERAEFDESVRQYLAGTPLTTIATSLLAEEPELLARLGEVTDETFVRRLYTDVLGRQAQSSEVQAWSRRLQDAESREVAVVALSESPDMVVRTRTVAPAAPPAPAEGRAVLAVGDSVVLGAAARISEIRGWGVHVDARSCRQATTRVDGCGAVGIPSGLDALRVARQRGALGGTVVMLLGNNGGMSDKDFDALMNLVSDQPTVLVLNLRLTRDWEASSNRVIAAGVARWPNARLVDWHAAALAHPEWFTDGVHLSEAGARGMAGVLAAALPR